MNQTVRLRNLKRTRARTQVPPAVTRTLTLLRSGFAQEHLPDGRDRGKRSDMFG